MTDQQQHQPLEITGEDLALLLKQTILTFCQMNVAYRNKLEVVGSIHIKADEVDISSFLLQENCLQSAVAQPKSDEDLEHLEDALKDGAEGGEKMEDTFCIVDANGDEQDAKSEKEGKNGRDSVSEKDGHEDTDNMDIDAKRDAESAENDAAEKETSENTDKSDDEENKGDADSEKKDDILSSSPSPPTTQASVAKQLTGASLSAVSSSMTVGPRPVTLMMNGTHPMMRGGIPMMRHSTTVTSSASMPLSSTAMAPRIPMPHAAMVAMGAQMAIHPHHMFLPHAHGAAVPRHAHISARAAIESIYRQNPPLTNRTLNLAAGGAVLRHPSMAAMRGGAILRHPQMPAGFHMMPRPAGGLVCPLCMATFASQDQYLRHLTSHQRSSVF